MKENAAQQIFDGFKKQLIKQLGTKVTTNEQLNKVGYKILGSRFKGTYAQDQLPINKSGMYIVNNHTSKQSGEHWVAVISTTKRIYVFDSFGRKSKTLLKILYKNARSIGKIVIDSDYDIDQSISSEICGPLSLAWLLTAKHIGISNALKI